MYVIQVPKRDELQAWLKGQGISTGIHYPIPIHLQKAMGFLGYQQGDLPVSERMASQILSLPMYAELEEKEISNTVETISDFYG